MFIRPRQVFFNTQLNLNELYIIPLTGFNYLGQVATVVGWAEAQTVEGPVIASCRPRKSGLPVLGHDECLGTAADPQYYSADKGCVGVIGAPSVVCNVS